MFIVSSGVLLGQGRGNESVAQGAGTGDAAASTGDEDGQETGDGGEDGHSKGLPFAEHATHPGLNRVVHPGGLFHLGGQSTETVEGLGARPVRGRVVGDERAALLTEHGADTSLLSQEHVQGHTILEGHQGSGSQLGRDALHGTSGEVGFGTVDVGDLDAIELAEARVRVVSLWGVGIIGGGDGSASAGRGVIDSTLGGLGGCVFVNVGAAETVAAAGLPLPCRVVGGCQGRGYRGRGRRFRVESQEHVQGQQACQHTQQGCHIQRLAFVVAPVVPPVVQWVHRARDQGGLRELGRRFWRCGFQPFWYVSGGATLLRTCLAGRQRRGWPKVPCLGLSTLVRVSSSCGP